jgi:tripartite ATP-independent transporter DctM subunit
MSGQPPSSAEGENVPGAAPPERVGRLATALDRLPQAVLVVALLAAALIPLIDALGRWVRELSQWLPPLEPALRPLVGVHVPGSAALIQHLTLWLAFVGALVTTRRRQHLTLSTIEFLGSSRAKSVAHLVSGALAAATTALLCYAAAQVVREDRSSPRTLPGGIPEWVSECVMPAALGLMALLFAWGASTKTWGRIVALAAIPAVFSLGLIPEQAAAWAFPLSLLVLAAAALGAPIFVVMGALALLFFFKDGTPIAAVSAEISRLMASPLIPAIPLLTACGYVLAEGAASERLLRFFRALFGWMPGGLAIIVTGVCALFTTFTGGSGVTIVAVGGLLYPMLMKDGYPRGFSLGLVTAAGSLGLLFPPSLPVILYSVVASAGGRVVAADRLYLAGLLPGILMAAIVAAYGVLVGRGRERARQSFAWRELGAATWAAKWELLLPVAIVGLFASGQTSMVETAAAALVFALITQCVLSRDLPIRRAPSALVKAGSLMGAVLLLLSIAMGLTAYLVEAELAARLLEWVTLHIHSQALFLLALNGLLLIVGCLIDIFSAIVVVVPLVAPIGAAFGVDPVHMGIIFLANLELGFLTPPIGMNLFLSSSRFGVPLMRVWRDTLPFLIVLAVGVLAITYAPQLSLGVLRLLGR